MSISSRKEIRTSVLNTTQQDVNQIGDLVNDFINITLNEINDPGWAYPRKNFHHLWSWLRQKTSFTTKNGAEDYVLAREVDKIALIRQTKTPIKLIQIPDEKFFRLVPNPTSSGNPKWYRLWDRQGVAVKLATADTIDVVSDSTGDAGDSTLAVTVEGYVGGIWTKETYALNGTTKVTGSNTFQAREIVVSKQRDTTGLITVSENSGGTTLVTLGPAERAPKFKVMTLYPKPTTAIEMLMEFYTRIPELENDSDVPIIDRKWHHIVRMGALAKTFQYLNKETNFINTQTIYANAVRGMVSSDRTIPDLLTHLTRRRADNFPFIWVRRSQDKVVV